MPSSSCHGHGYLAPSGGSAPGWPEELAGAPGDVLEVGVPAGERAIGQVGEADVELVAAQALAEAGNIDAGHVVVIADHGPENDGGQPSVPGSPEGEPGDLVQEVAVGRAGPVEDRREPRSVRRHEDVAVEQVAVQHLADLRAGVQPPAERVPGRGEQLGE